MKRLCIAFILFALIPTAVYAQEKGADKKVSQRKQARILMKEQIKQLKAGVLLVRLQTKENAVSSLKEIRKYKLADRIMKRQLRYNKEIISAFKNNFTFCPAYFFFSNYSDSILSGQTNGIVFLNDNLEPDTTIKLNNEKFLTAEFGIIEQETTKHFSNYYYFPGENGPQQKSAYYNKSNMRFGALKIMSGQLEQLKRPFPYYVRTFDFLPFKRKPSKTVMRMNKLLAGYYGKNNG
ncbi:MAG TPA: hypothetical protein VJY62_12445 [Bacteroidia bacterium]|nr:hypothetical protein [Bacteroidia bacterium]